MYYDDGGTPSFADNDKIKVCKGTLLGWQELGGGAYWDKSTADANNIYYTQSGNVGIGTDTPQAKLHIKETVTGSGQVGVVTTFDYTGNVQYYTVPTGITMLTIVAYGAQGGMGYLAAAGGYGGQMKADISVVPGERLCVYVGGQVGGWNGGGAGRNAEVGAGGGASDVRKGGCNTGERIIVAGGGGGSSTCYIGSGCLSGGGGGGGYPSGSNGVSVGGSGSTSGAGGSQSGGGKGGYPYGDTGTFSGGGSGGTQNGVYGDSGGGGGGYYGGGGGGGGGSSWVTNLATNISYQNSVNSGNGKVVITTTTSGQAALYVEGVLGVSGSKNFIINHPSKPGMKLVHSSLEGPEAGVYYRGEARLDNGQAVISLPDYFEALTRTEDRTIQVSAKGNPPYMLSYGEIENGEFTVYGTKPDGRFSWEVKAVRKDIAPLIVEKPDIENKKIK